MAAIPGAIRRGETVRRNAPYYRYGMATWEWWCRQNDCEFILLDQPLGVDACPSLPPTLQRWLAPQMFVERFGLNIEIAMVDADTMIRWDAPSLFDAAQGHFAGVLDGNARWIHRSAAALGSFFPDIELPWWDFVNAGVIVVPGKCAKIMSELVRFVVFHWPELSQIMAAQDVGTDQTLLNLFVKSAGLPVRALPLCFNMLHCVNINAFEAVLAASSQEETDIVFSSDTLYDFIPLGYIWHFTNVLEHRERAMAETWNRICAHYNSLE